MTRSEVAAMERQMKRNAKKLTAILAALRMWITKSYGNPCRAYEKGCCVCESWKQYRALKKTLRYGVD